MIPRILRIWSEILPLGSRMLDGLHDKAASSGLAPRVSLRVDTLTEHLASALLLDCFVH